MDRGCGHRTVTTSTASETLVTTVAAASVFVPGAECHDRPGARHRRAPTAPLAAKGVTVFGDKDYARHRRALPPRSQGSVSGHAPRLPGGPLQLQRCGHMRFVRVRFCSHVSTFFPRSGVVCYRATRWPVLLRARRCRARAPSCTTAPRYPTRLLGVRRRPRTQAAQVL